MSTQGPKVRIEMSMSLDGFVARSDHSTEEVHAWYEGGDVELRMPNHELTFHLQCLQLGLLDELQIHLVPVLLGAGVRMFDAIDEAPVQLEQTRVVEGRGVVHLFYDVVGTDRVAA
jgi:riboflavin biosynthesis pyrimidine reductase